VTKGYGTVDVNLGSKTIPMLFDTGFSQSALSVPGLDGLNASDVTFSFGEARAGPMAVGLLLYRFDLSGVLGSDVLHQLPLIFDARARTIEILSAFESPQGGMPVFFADSGQCQSRDSGLWAPTFWIEGKVEGHEVNFVLDTGAESTFVRSDLAAALGERPKLEGIRIASGFAGAFDASAIRASSISLLDAEGARAAVLSSPQVDRELERLTSRAQSGPRCSHDQSCKSPPSF
jgi:hypothetical protein